MLCVVDFSGDGDSVQGIGTGTSDEEHTQFAIVSSADSLFELLSNPGFHDEESEAFYKLKKLVVPLPVRKVLSRCWTSVWLNPANDEETVELFDGAGRLSTKGDGFIWKYTSGKNWYCTRINLLLALDRLEEAQIEYVQSLHQCIIHQTPKFSGKVFRGALHCPVEIFIFCFKRFFFIPSFTSTSTSIDRFFWNPWDEEKAKTQYNLQNILFEIDISEYNRRSTLIQQHQTRYNEDECLLSCYNIYEWKGYRVLNGIPIVSLKVLNFEEYCDRNTGSIKGAQHGDVPMAWLEKKGEVTRTRDMTPAQLDFHIRALFSSHDRNIKKEGWDEISWKNIVI